MVAHNNGGQGDPEVGGWVALAAPGRDGIPEDRPRLRTHAVGRLVLARASMRLRTDPTSGAVTVEIGRLPTFFLSRDPVLQVPQPRAARHD